MESLDKGILKTLLQKLTEGNISTFFTSLLIFSLLQRTEGVCYTVKVSGAVEYSGYSSLNNYYYALNVLCGYLNVWGDDYNSDYSHYLVPRSNLPVPGTNTTTYGWAIASSYLCNGNPPYYYAYTLTSSSVPYGIGGWYQWNQVTREYFLNNNLVVNCYTPVLSAWAITGIVLASLCGVALLVAIVACICSKHKQKKARTQAPQPNPPSTAVYVTTNDYATIGEGLPPSGNINPALSVPMSPPAYDDSPPPAYNFENDTEHV